MRHLLRLLVFVFLLPASVYAADPADARTHALDAAARQLEAQRARPDPLTFSQAQARIEQHTRSHADDARGWVLLGWVRSVEHRFAEALTALERAASLNVNAVTPDAVQGLTLRIDVLTELGRYDEAAAHADRLADLAPGIPAWLRVAHLRYLFGDLAGAIELTARAARAGRPKGESSAWVWLDLLRLQLAAHQPEAAQAALTAARRAAPDLPALASALASAQARLDLAAGRDAEALASYSAAVAAYPNVEDAYEAWRLARKLGRSGPQKHLAALLDGLQKIDPVRSRRTLAEYRLEAGETDAALKLAREEYVARPDLYSAATLARALAHSGQADAARRHAAEALRLGTPDRGFDDLRRLIHAPASARPEPFGPAHPAPVPSAVPAPENDDAASPSAAATPC